MNTKNVQGNALPLSSSLAPERNLELEELVMRQLPAKPLYVLYPEIIKARAKAFLDAFPGTPLYAVKTNPDPCAIQALIQGGVNAFDVASLSEIQLVKNIAPTAELHFMHPVKAPEDIRKAYFEYGVRHFVLDHEDELFKIMRETELAQDLNLTIRLSLPKNDSALIDFSSKFGASFEDALMLLQKCRPVSKILGLSFHVGTQTTNPNRYSAAIKYCADLINTSDIKIDSLNVGGGFPVAYADSPKVCSVQNCASVIKNALQTYNLSDIILLAEPGRVLVAEGMKLVTRVELRKDTLLYINDGVYGGLFDAANWVGTSYPVSAISCDSTFNGAMQSFTLAGPTCDSLDMMKGPFMLPADIGIGDWIVFDNVGAYSHALRSDFNGFGHADFISVPFKMQI